MKKLKSIKSGILLVFLTIGLAACSKQQAAEVGSTPAKTQVAAKAAPPPVCNSCGVVSSVTALKREGRGTGVGAALGAVVGGLAGHQVGGGNGQKVATVAGAVGGAVVGNNIEGNRNDETSYEITVDMENGGQRTVTVADAAAIGVGVGSRVTVSGNAISLR